MNIVAIVVAFAFGALVTLDAYDRHAKPCANVPIVTK